MLLERLASAPVLLCRQCLCCFKEYKHLEVFNQLVYALINLVIAQISSLRDRLCSSHKAAGSGTEGGAGPVWGREGSASGPLRQPASPGEDEHVNVERDSAEEDADTPDPSRNAARAQEAESQVEACEPVGGGGEPAEGQGGGGRASGADSFSSWSTEEREKLLLCAAKIFQIQFPLYTAYKHNTHPTIEVRRSIREGRLSLFAAENLL